MSSSSFRTPGLSSTREFPGLRLTNAAVGRCDISGRFIIFWPYTVRGDQGQIHSAQTCCPADSSSRFNPDSSFDPGRIDAICHLYTFYRASLPLHLTDA
jgi:hypothetical protein